MGRHGTGGSENSRKRGSRRSEDAQEADFRTATDPAATWSLPLDSASQNPVTTGAFMVQNASESGPWQAADPSADPHRTGAWAPAPQQTPPGGDPHQTGAWAVAPVPADPPQPGWPLPPDQIEVTGQWAPAPPLPPHRAADPDSGPKPYDARDPYGSTAVFGAPTPLDAPDAHGATAAFDSPGGPPGPADRLVAGGPTTAMASPSWDDDDRPAETGFLGSGWSDDDASWAEDDKGDGKGSRRRRGRRRPPSPDGEWADERAPGGRSRMALLAVAAVAVVLGGTVIGVRLVSGAGDTPEKCEGSACAVMSSNQPSPGVSGPPVEEEEEPAEEPVEADPSPTKQEPTTTARTPRRTVAPQPTPTRTRKQTANPTPEPKATEVSDPDPSPESSETPWTGPDMDKGGDDGGSATVAPPVQEPTTPVQPQSMNVGGAAVNVGFDVVNNQLAGYTAELRVANASTAPLPGFELSLPVGGEILEVDGAEWRQDGGTLVLESIDELAEGARLQVTIHAYGEAAPPATCELSGGKCALA